MNIKVLYDERFGMEVKMEWAEQNFSAIEENIVHLGNVKESANTHNDNIKMSNDEATAVVWFISYADMHSLAHQL